MQSPESQGVAKADRRWTRIVPVAPALSWLFPTTSALAANLTVNTVADVDDSVCNAQDCSLREAINAANATPGPDTISSDLGGPGPDTILLVSPLSPITDGGTAIDGTSQPGYTGAPRRRPFGAPSFGKRRSVGRGG